MNDDFCNELRDIIALAMDEEGIDVEYTDIGLCIERDGIQYCIGIEAV